MKTKLMSIALLFLFGISISSAWAGVPGLFPPNQEPEPVRKNRYISFVPTNNGQMTAIRVRLTSLQHPAGNPPDVHDYSAYEGQYRWVGAPSDYLEDNPGSATFRAAALQCEPFYMNWGPVGLLNVYGFEVIPDSVYEIQAIRQNCDINNEACYSDTMQVLTGKWGDVEVPFAHETTATQPDFGDIAAVVEKFKVGPNARTKPRIQLYDHSVNPAKSIDFSDIAAVVNTFRGELYDYSGPADCPPAKNANSIPRLGAPSKETK